MPQSDVWVEWPGVTEPITLKTDSKGEARVPWRVVTERNAEFIGIRAMVSETKSGEADGKRYTSIHRWATLTFPADGAQKGAGQREQPLTQVLRASFGNSHDVVSGAEFNKTLFAGKLTRPQLDTFLQQRALIHIELDRILDGAAPAGHVPYGPAQKNLLALLLKDLTAMGLGRPAESQALPLTHDFLQEIRDSEKQGPYFALGVFHVYYGGTTNGGRDIGEKIAETLKVNLTYYEKSDGYPEYLTEVNKIDSALAREEMARGGQAAYRYIIASTNVELYKVAFR